MSRRQISSNVLPTQSSSWTLFKLNVNRCGRSDVPSTTQSCMAYFDPLHACCARAILYQRREKWVIIAAGMVSVIIGLLFGVLFWKQVGL